MCWSVVHVRAGREPATADLLERRLHLRVYLPEVLQRRRGKLQSGPLFPGYVFVSDQDAAGVLADVDITPGCGRLLRRGGLALPAGEPLALADHIIEHMQQQVAALNDTGGLPAHNLHPGDEVTITSGPMRGLAAVLVSPLTPAARVKVLLHFLGRDQEVTVELENVEPASPAFKRVRRTRGHGRRIHGI